MKAWFIMILFLVVLVVGAGGLFAFNLYNKIQGFKKPQPPTTISSMKAESSDWHEQITSVGSLRAVRGSDLSAEVDGIIDTISFESGQDVKEGTVLATLRAADLRSQLAALKATAELSRITLERDKTQFSDQAISQAVLDTDNANYRSALAQVAEEQALIDKKIIRAPFAGRVGIRAVDLGQFVKAGDKLVTLQTLDPIYVDFDLPQQNLSQISVGQKIVTHVDSFPDLAFEGSITAVDPKIDSDTRNVAVRATLRNPQDKLIPGMFGNIAVDIGHVQRYVTLPQTAITFNPYGETVFLVVPADQLGSDAPPGAAPGAPAKPTSATPGSGSQSVAKQVLIKVGATRGDQIAILSGIKEGEEVVTSGQLKLKNGAPVQVNNDLPPKNDPSPDAPNE